MSEVDHDDIAKQLIDALHSKHLSLTLDKLRSDISESTILALSSFLMSAVSIDLNRAAEIYNLQRQIASLINSKRADGYLKCQLAFMKTSAGDHGGALKLFESVRANYVGHFEDFYTLSLYANLVSLYVTLGKREEAESLATVIRDFQNKVGKKGISALARTETTLGILYHKIGKLWLALEAYDKALKLFERIDKKTEQLFVSHNMALVLREQGQISRSLNLLNAIKNELEILGLHNQVANTTMGIAITEARSGNFLKANMSFERARELFNKQQLIIKMAEVDLFQSILFLEFRLAKDALRLAQSSLHLFGANGGTFWDRTLVKLVIGLSLKLLGKLDESRKHLAQVVCDYSEVGAHQYSNFASLTLADFDPLTTTEVDRLSKVLIRDYSNSVSTTNLLILAKIMLSNGDSSLAMDEVYKVLQLTKNSLSAEQRIQAFHILGKGYKNKRDYEKSWSWLSQSLEQLDNVIRYLYTDELRTSLVGKHYEIFQDFTDVSITKFNNDQQTWADLFEAVNIGAKYLFSPSLEKSTESRELESLQKELANLQALWYWNSETANGIWNFSKKNNMSETEKGRSLLELENEVIDQSRRLQLLHTNHIVGQRSKSEPAFYDLCDFQNSIANDKAHIQFFLSHQYCHATVYYFQDSILIERIAPVKTIDRLLRSWRFIINSRAYSPDEQIILKTLRQFYDIFIAKLPSKLTQHRELSVSLPSKWHDLPIHAFFDGKNFLLENVEITFEVSPSYKKVKASLLNKVVLIGNSGNGRIQETEKEIATLNDFLSNLDLIVETKKYAVSRREFEKLILASNVIHVASHASYRKRNALFASLHIADPPILALEIARMQVHPGALVFLNACRTGLGTATEGSVDGFVRSFLMAGAANVIASLWELDDHFARKFTQDFYMALFSTSGGKPLRTLINLQRKSIQNGLPILGWAAYVHWQK